MQDRPDTVALFTDFGHRGPYHGQMRAVLAAAGISQPVIQLMTDAPCFAPRPSAYLLSAIARDMPEGTLFICVVDPGVGSDRRPIIIKDSGQWFIGPDNGLLSQVARRSVSAQVEEITWRPECISNSFHGRDLFAPVAAAVCNKESFDTKPLSLELLAGSDWPDDLAEVIYVDDFGNAMTGLRASQLADNTKINLGGENIQQARTFSEVGVGEAFWYGNSLGLVEISINQGNASKALDLAIGSALNFHR